MNERIKDKVDLDIITLDDYSVRMYNLLRGTNEVEVKKHFSRFGEVVRRRLRA